MTEHPDRRDPRDDELKKRGARLAARLREAHALKPPRRRIKGHPVDCNCFFCIHA